MKKTLPRLPESVVNNIISALRMQDKWITNGPWQAACACPKYSLLSAGTRWQKRQVTVVASWRGETDKKILGPQVRAGIRDKWRSFGVMYSVHPCTLKDFTLFRRPPSFHCPVCRVNCTRGKSKVTKINKDKYDVSYSSTNGQTPRRRRRMSTMVCDRQTTGRACKAVGTVFFSLFLNLALNLYPVVHIFFLVPVLCGVRCDIKEEKVVSTGESMEKEKQKKKEEKTAPR